MTSTSVPSRRVALVTGAARGIGKGIALRLAKDGLHVAINDLSSNHDALLSLSEEIRSLGKANGFTGLESSIHISDVSKEEDVKKMVEEVVERLGGLDVMIANAGVCPVLSIFETTTEDFDRAFAINVRGTFLCYKYAGAQMIKQGRGGRIIGASSMAGKTGADPEVFAYIGTKFAIRGITQAAAAEFGKHKITVNAYAPGMIDTPLANEFVVQKEKNSKMNPGDFIKTHNSKCPLGYAGVPEDIAGLVSYLVSDAAHFITGQSISINGGLYCD